MVFMAHAEWMHSGDTEWLKHRYEALKKRILLDRSGNDGLVRSSEADRNRNDIVDWPAKERDGFVFTEINTVVNAFHIQALKQMSQMARAVGKDADAIAFEQRVKLATASFQMKLFDDTAGIYRDGSDTDHSSIHANFFPLAFGLVPESKRDGVVAWLKQKKMQCSVYAAQYFMEALFESGSDVKALKLILADGDRSWKHMLKSGTTITWEAWDLKYKPNQDWNHAWGAAPANLLPRYVLGAQPAQPGWTLARIRPCPSGLSFASGKIPTPLGPIAIQWTNEPGFKMELALPEGMNAKVHLPASEKSVSVWMNGKAIDAEKQGGYWIITDEVSGSVSFEVK
jgi:hypothetical protein